MKKISSILLIILSLAVTSAIAQEVEENYLTASQDLKGNHSISLFAGYQDITSKVVAVSTTSIDVGTHVIGFLRYQYWPENHSAISLSVGMFSTETNVRFFRTTSTTVIPILIGYTFYPNSFAVGKAGRFFIGANIGTYLQSISDVSVGFFSFGSRSETDAVFGAEFHTGIDFFVSEWMKIGPQVSWHTIDNYHGPAISVSFGVML